MSITTRKLGPKKYFGTKTGFTTLASTLVLTSLATSQYASAQEDENNGEKRITEEVVVTGVRQSLETAQEIKRQGDTFVDAISAQDIGALPDRSVLESISRLPGVSIERFASPDDPDRFSSEGSGAVVRGMTATRTEFNGRDSFTASSGRGLSFQDISPELMSAVKLYKNQTADMIEGGIGGTVSMYTRKPFDQPDGMVAFSADYTYFDLSEEYAPSVSGLLSDRWDTNLGELGVLVSIAHGKSRGQSDSIQMNYFNTNDNSPLISNSPLEEVRYPSGSNLATKFDDRTRHGSAVSIQHENPSKTVLTTFEWIRSDSHLKWTERRAHVGAWDTTYGRTTRPAEGTLWAFDETGTFVSGVLAHSNQDWRGQRWDDGIGFDNLRVPVGPGQDDYCYTLDPADGPGGAAEQDCNLRSRTFGRSGGTSSRIMDQNTLVDDYSFNMKFSSPNEKWEVEADLHYIDAKSAQTDMTINTGFWALNYLDNSGGVPRMALINPWEVVPDENYRPNDYPEPEPGFWDTVGNLTALEQANVENGAVPIDRFAPDYFARPSSYWWNDAQDHYMRAQGEEKAFRLDGTYFIDDSFFKAIKTGIRMSDRQQEVWSTDYSTWGSLSPMRALDRVNGESGYAAAWLDLHPGPDYETVDWSNFYRGDGTFMGISQLNEDGTVAPIDHDARFELIHPSMEMMENYHQWGTQLADAIYRGSENHWVPAAMRDPDDDGLPETQGYFLPEELSDVREVNQAAYVRLDFGSDDFALRFDGNIGLRYFQVDLESSGYVRFPDLRPTDPETDPDYYTNVNNYLSQTETDFANNATELTHAEHDYSHFLPSFNLKVELTEDLLGRFAVSKAVSLPDIGDLRSYLNIRALMNETEYAELSDPNDTLAIREIESASVRSWTASGGNPYLLPMESIQWDASLEWYFADVGSLTTSIFYKDLENFFVDGAFARPVTNPVTGVTQDVLVSGKINAGEGSLRGFEIAYQQWYDMLPGPFDGIGTQFNYTYIDVNGVPNPALEGAEDYRDEAVKQKLPLQSQSRDTVNVALMYEKYDWEFRAAYNWRSEYLITARDGANFPFPPTWSAPAGYLDVSLFYNVNDNIKLGFQGNNLTDTIAETQFQSTSTLTKNGRSWFMNDRRYTLVLRAKF